MLCNKCILIKISLLIKKISAVLNKKRIKFIKIRITWFKHILEAIMPSITVNVII